MNAWTHSKGVRALALLSCLGISASANARDGDGSQAPTALIKAATAYVETALRVPPGAHRTVAFVPPRSTLGLKACEVPLEASAPFLPETGGPLSVRVACPSPWWSIYLPGELHITAEVWVAARDLPRDTELRASDLTLQRLPLHRQAGGFALRTESLEGRRLRYPLARGAVVPPRATASPLWVRTGEPIMLAAGKGPLAVRMGGVALSNGAENDTVRVRNHGSRQVLQGRVVGPGEVKIGF
ncbi:MAG: flagellar basal body P-ring formation chaperone FlgA [Pseudomonadales bacterium]